MAKHPTITDDPTGSAAHYRQTLLDTATDPAFDRLTRMATQLLQTSLALVGLVDHARVFIKSQIGLPEPWASKREILLTDAFCHQMIISGEIVLITDARQDKRMSQSPLIERGLVAYAGVPLMTDTGKVMGSFCVADTTPHQWTDSEMETLQDLAASVMTEIQLRQELADHKRMGEALRQSEEQYRTLVETMNEGLCMTDADFVIRYANQRFAEIVGFTVEEIVGQRIEDITADEYKEVNQQQIQNRKTGKSAPYETVLRHRDGHRVHVLSFPKGQYDAKGRLVGSIGTVMDITAQKQTEATLAAERNMLRTIIDNAPDYIFVKDREARFVTSNIAHAAAADAQPNDLIGKTALDFFPTAYAQQFHDDDQQVMETGKPLINQERETTNETGNPRWVLTTKIPLRNEQGEVTGLVGLSRDITDYKQMVEALRESESRFRAINDASPVGIFLTNEADSCVYVNRAYEQITGQEWNEAVNDGWLTGIHPEDRDTVKAQWEAYLTQTDKLYESTYRYVIPGQDSLTWVSVKAVPIQHGNRVLGHLGTVEDITHRIEAEKESIELAVEREKVAMLKAFIDHTSHDFRTPLTIIASSVYLLEKAVDDASRQRHIGKLNTEIERMQNLLDDMLTMSWLDSTSLDFDNKPCDVNNLIETIITYQSVLVEERSHKLRFNPAPLPLITANQEALRRVINNILLNALLYTPSGGEVTITTFQRVDRLGIRIQDTGIGIATEDLPHIFERFFRANKARSVDTGGTGLALAIANKIIEAHRGTIDVESASGEGSIFTVWLPLD